MCEPATIIAAVGTVIGAYGQYQQGQSAKAYSEYQSKMSEYNAAVARNNAIYARMQAEDSERRGGMAEDLHRSRVRQAMGSARARLAANGMDVNTEVGLDLQADSAAAGEYDAQIIRLNAMREAFGYRQSAANMESGAAGLDSQAGAFRTQGAMQARSGMAGAFGTMLTGAGAAYDKFSSWRTKQPNKFGFSPGAGV